MDALGCIFSDVSWGHRVFWVFSNTRHPRPGQTQLAVIGPQLASQQLLTSHQHPIFVGSQQVIQPCPLQGKFNHDYLLGRTGEDDQVWTEGCWGNVLGKLQLLAKVYSQLSVCCWGRGTTCGAWPWDGLFSSLDKGGVLPWAVVFAGGFGWSYCLRNCFQHLTCLQR